MITEEEFLEYAEANTDKYIVKKKILSSYKYSYKIILIQKTMLEELKSNTYKKMPSSYLTKTSGFSASELMQNNSTNTLPSYEAGGYTFKYEYHFITHVGNGIYWVTNFYRPVIEFNENAA